MKTASLIYEKIEKGDIDPNNETMGIKKGGELMNNIKIGGKDNQKKDQQGGCGC